jgi:FixJ family two-component response regulator
VSPYPRLARTNNYPADFDNAQSAIFYIYASTMAKQPRAIALIDDDPLIRDSLRRFLARFGYRIDSFASGEDFLGAAASGAWDCLMIDLELGATSGLQLLQHATVRTLNLPTIVISGTDDNALWQQALALGCAGYLKKPFRGEELLRALQRAGID